MNENDIIEYRKWKFIETSAAEACKICGRACTPKDIGIICEKCVNGVPSYIPNEQIMRYLKSK